MAEPDLGGCIQFIITSNPDQIKDWSAESISTFFRGIAQIVRAAGANAEVEITADTAGEAEDLSGK